MPPSDSCSKTQSAKLAPACGRTPASHESPILIAKGRRLRTAGSETFSPVKGLTSGEVRSIIRLSGVGVGGNVGLGGMFGVLVGRLVGLTIARAVGLADKVVDGTGLPPQAAKNAATNIRLTTRIDRHNNVLMFMLHIGKSGRL